MGPLGLLERGNVVMAQDGRDGDHTVAPVYQDQIHQEPGGAPVAVPEGVDVHQPPVGVGGQQDRVRGVLPFVQILYQPGHKARHLLRRGRDIFRAGDEHLALPVASGVLRVNAAVEQGVQVEYILLLELQGPAPGGLQHIVIGPGVAGGLVAVPDGLAAHGDTVLQEHLGLREGEGIALQGVGGISHADAEVGVQLLHLVRGEGAALPYSLGVCVNTV